ncbi:hypothetical protein CSHISOI_10835 [Colletotrichum shisoi]|uniref:Uncharacterized protein n=1 Tax=Colletotrichum shisoi TaxID=2078593 RepID=A0A5Q4BCN5_9PEZI|nr:hypothetical protein CSHISOI_10835 [Colletotrichum shisoi]
MPSSYFMQTPRRIVMRWYVLNLRAELRTPFAPPRSGLPPSTPVARPSPHPASRIPRPGIPPTVAVVAVGYGLNVYREGMVQRRLARTAAAEKQAIEDRKRATMLMDAYGDRSSLEALEKAMEVYESQNQA